LGHNLSRWALASFPVFSSPAFHPYAQLDISSFFLTGLLRPLLRSLVTSFFPPPLTDSRLQRRHFYLPLFFYYLLAGSVGDVRKTSRAPLWQEAFPSPAATYALLPALLSMASLQGSGIDAAFPFRRISLACGLRVTFSLFPVFFFWGPRCVPRPRGRSFETPSITPLATLLFSERKTFPFFSVIRGYADNPPSAAQMVRPFFLPYSYPNLIPPPLEQDFPPSSSSSSPGLLIRPLVSPSLSLRSRCRALRLRPEAPLRHCPKVSF